MPDEQTPPNGQTPNDGNPPGQMPTTPTPQGQIPNGTQKKTAFDDLPPDTQENIRILRAEAKELRKQVEADALAKEQAKEQQLREQGEYQKLAEMHQSRVKELEPVVERYNQLSELVAEQIKARVKEWPQEVKSLIHGKETPIELRLEQVEKLQALADRFTLQAQGQQPGNRPNPRPSQNMTPDEVSEKALNELRARSPGKYQL